MALAAATVLGLIGTDAAAAPRDGDYFTNLPLVTQDGRTVRFWDDLLKDRIVVISFFYTDCPDMCSLATARLAHLYQWLGERMGRDIFFYSITLDPENDTVGDIATFADSFGAGPGWTFLTGTRENIDVIRHKVGERARSLSEHRSDFLIGNARTGVWRRTSAMGSLAIALQSILEMDAGWQGAAFADAAPAADYDLSAHPGEAIFLKVCASCHTVGLGRKIGPDLAAVTLRRDRDWLTRFLMDPDDMLKAGDPIAVALDADFPGVRMPDLGLGATDAEDLIAYLVAADQKIVDGEAGLAAIAAASAEAPPEAGHDHAAHSHAGHSHTPTPP